jgi:glycerol uptake facilitator-like aquaporin
MAPRGYIAEFAGTFAWVFLCAAVILTDAILPISGDAPPTAAAVIGPPGIALVAGLSYAGLLAATVPLSGGFLNPAVVLALWVFHRLDTGRAVALAAVQFAGAAVGGLAVRGFLSLRQDAVIAARLGTPHLNLPAFGATRVGPGVLVQGMGVEATLTFALTFVILAVYFDPRTNGLLGGFARRWANVAVGLMVFAEVLAAGRITGAAMNPARWFGTVVWELTVPELEARRPLADHAVYWVGPTIGALLAGILYHYLILPQQKRDEPTTTK